MTKRSIKKEKSKKEEEEKKSIKTSRAKKQEEKQEKKEKVKSDKKQKKKEEEEEIEVEEEMSQGEDNGSDNEEKPKKGKKTRMEKAKEAIKEIEKPKNTGVIYIGHLPWGFQDEALKKYFVQFGDISRIIVPRTAKTGRSVGYAFIEFREEETAKIAAKTMDNYLLFDRIIKCNVVEDKSKYDRIFKKWKKQFKFCDKYKKHLEEQDKPKSDEEIKSRIQMLLDREKIKKEKISEMKINYEYPGFESLIENYKKTHQTNEKKKASTASEKEEKKGKKSGKNKNK